LQPGGCHWYKYSVQVFERARAAGAQHTMLAKLPNKKEKTRKMLSYEARRYATPRAPLIAARLAVVVSAHGLLESQDDFVVVELTDVVRRNLNGKVLSTPASSTQRCSNGGRVSYLADRSTFSRMLCAGRAANVP